jgi:hypothetical protein
MHVEEDLRSLRPTRHGGKPPRQRTAVNRAALARGGWSAETIGATAEADEVLVALSAAEGGDWTADDGDGGSGVMLTPQQLAETEAQVAAAVGAYGSSALADDTAAGAVFRYSQIHQAEQLRAMGYAVAPRQLWEMRAETPSTNVMPLTYDVLDSAVYEESGFGKAVPEHATSWARPGEDWQRGCYCDLTNAEMAAGHDCEDRTAPMGERALALSRVVMQVADPGGWEADAEDESVALSADYGDEFGLSVLSQAERDREKALGHTIAGTDDFPIPDKAHLSAAIARYKQGKLAGHPEEVVRRHILKHARRLGVDVELSAAEEMAMAASQDGTSAVEDAVDYYSGLARSMGLESATPLRVRNYHGKAGGGRRVGSRTRAHAGELQDEWDSQPVESITDVEAILRRNGYAASPTGDRSLSPAASRTGATPNSMDWE